MSTSITDCARLITLFDAAAECHVDLSLWECDEPEVATTLALWASSRHLRSERLGGDTCPMFEVRLTSRRSILVYLMATRKEQAA